MKSYLFLILTFFAIQLTRAQAVYKGFIDSYPIELVIYNDGDNYVAFYSYTKFDEPITIAGKGENGDVLLNEKDKLGKVKATFRIEQFDVSKTELSGIWKDLQNNKELKIKLNKIFDFETYKSTGAKKQEILQGKSLSKKYFKLVVNTASEEDFMRVIAVRVYEKKTDKLLQEFEVDCEFRGEYGFKIEDYNFDGNLDFSVFEAQYAGPNTSSVYFLQDKSKGTFFRSEIFGTSLEFDKKTKHIYERNQCCAGNGIMTVVYKLVNNRMVSISKTCEEWDEKSNKHITVKCE